MPTKLQRDSVNKLVEAGGIIGKAMVLGGYSPKTAKTPQKLTESQGFDQLCKEAGLSKKLILTSLAEDIEKKPQNRVQELNLGAKIMGIAVDRSDSKLKVEIGISKDVSDKYEK